MRKKEMLQSILLKQERLTTQLMEIDAMIKSFNSTKDVDILDGYTTITNYDTTVSELIEKKKELVVGKWYKYQYKCGLKQIDGYLLFNFNGKIGEDSQYGFTHTSSGHKFVYDITICEKYIPEYIEATAQEVESALIEEAKRRYNVDNKIESFDLGEFNLLGFGLKYNQERNILYASGGGNHVIFNNGKWASIIKQHIDKLAELKEAHNNGAVIQMLSKHNSEWVDVDFECDYWLPNYEYRIKPEEKPKVDWKESLKRESHIYEIATNQLVKICHGLAKDAGWHDKPREVGTMLALIHSEVSEAMEGFRKDLNDDHLTNRKMAEVELADAVIRIFDLAGAQGFDLGGALVEKLVYNTQRSDHKIENRQGENGKKF